MTEQMRIGVLSDPGIVNAEYRSRLPFEALDGRGHHIIRNAEDRPLRLEELCRCDVVHVHRLATPDLLQTAEHLKHSGIGIVWDNDDHVAALPRSNPLHQAGGGRRRRERAAEVAAMVRLADVVTTPSEGLAAYYRELGAADVRVLENYLPREFAGARSRRHPGVVVMCLAALEHKVDYEQLRMADTLAGLLDAHPDLRVVSLGLRLGIRSDRYENRKGIPFLDLATELAAGDVGIAPLVDIPFNRARSNVKLKEYAAAGLAWLASPVGPYCGMGERQGGRLVPDGEWRDAIERLVVNARERRKLAKSAARWVKGEYVERHARKWEGALRDAIQHAAAGRTLAVG